ncbi:MAG TPA: pyridoxamine 5'-phosphate oxidase family protein [Acidimicrobiales bacterium]
MNIPHDNDDPDAELEQLPLAECWRLVRTQTVGRFAVNRPGYGPHVVPVNFIVTEDDTIVFRTGAGTKLNASMMRIVAMQFDEIDASRHTGWSVLVQGTARWLYEEQDPVEVDTWAPGPRPYVVRVTPVHVSGRRIQLHQMDTDDRGDM